MNWQNAQNQRAKNSKSSERGGSREAAGVVVGAEGGLEECENISHEGGGKSDSIMCQAETSAEIPMVQWATKGPPEGRSQE